MTDPTKEATSPPTAPKKKASAEGTIQENEIRVTAQGKMRNYVAYATTIFSENKSHTVVLKGMGRVISKTVSLAEILKRRVKGLYQFAEIGSIQVVDKKTSKGGNDDATEVVRLLSVIKIVLTTEPEDKAKYQEPVDETQLEPFMTQTPKKGRGNRSRKKTKKRDPEVKEDVVEKESQDAAAAKETPVVKESETEKPATKSKKKRRFYPKQKKAKKEAAAKEEPEEAKPEATKTETVATAAPPAEAPTVAA